MVVDRFSDRMKAHECLELWVRKFSVKAGGPPYHAQAETLLLLPCCRTFIPKPVFCLSELCGTVVEVLFKVQFQRHILYTAAISWSFWYRCIYESFLCMFQVCMFSPAKKKVSYTGHARVTKRLKSL